MDRSKRPLLRTLFLILPLLSTRFGSVPAAFGGEVVRYSGTGGAMGGMGLVAEAFMKANPDLKVVGVPSMGSGGGIKAVLAGRLDIALSARPLTGEERSKGVRETAFARTPFVFCTHPKVPEKEISLAEIVRIYEGKKTEWKDGSPLRLVLRPSNDSDTTFLKGISGGMAAAVDQAISRPGMIVAMTDQDSADAIEKTPGAFGTTTLSLVSSEKRAVTVLSVSGVKPSVKSGLDGSYPYIKTFYLVEAANPSPGARRFAGFVRSSAGASILSRVGHLPAR